MPTWRGVPPRASFAPDRERAVWAMNSNLEAAREALAPFLVLATAVLLAGGRRLLRALSKGGRRLRHRHIFAIASSW
jgi:hypothetical protein